MSLWRDSSPLVLASGSSARRALLSAAEIPHDIIKPLVDEAPIAEKLLAQRETPLGIAQALASAKGLDVSMRHPDRLVLAADQTLDADGQLGMKPPSLPAARAQLLALRGRSHALHSAAVLMRGGRILWSGHETAHLIMRAFSDAFLDEYLGLMGEKVLGTVGAYELEALGIHLFSSINGSQAAILGLPLSGILEALRSEGVLLG